MLLFSVAVMCGVAAGYSHGGRLQSLERIRVRASLLVLAAALLQAALGAAPASSRFPVLVGSYGLIGMWLVLNTRGRSPAARRAVALFGVGCVMNLIAIAWFAGMPVSGDALRRVGATELPVGAPNITKHVLTEGGEPVSWLGDVIPVPPLRTVVSAGDVAMMAGVALAVHRAMRPTRAADRIGAPRLIGGES